MSYLVNNAHFILIHIPIAMLVFSFVFDVLAMVVKKKEWHSAGLLCLVVGALGAIGSVITGPEDEKNALLHNHELFGQLTMVTAIILVAARVGLLLWKKRDIGNHAAYLVVALLCVGLVTYTGHLGGKMVHKDKTEMTNGNFRQGKVPNGEQGQGKGQGQGQGQGQKKADK